MKMIKKIIFTLIMVFLISGLKSQTEKYIDDVKGLLPGMEAPMFKAIDGDSIEFSLSDAIKKGPVVIIFYRGFWCPVCNKHLELLQDSLRLIKEKGAQVIAISPEKPEYLDKMAEQTGAKFRILYDEGYKIANAYDVTFKPKTMQLFTYNVVLGAKLKDTHSDDSQRLPIPATYIINEDGIIVWRQFDPDYKNRSSVKEILNALSKYQAVD
jgi:peroxiredoxin